MFGWTTFARTCGESQHPGATLDRSSASRLRLALPGGGYGAVAVSRPRVRRARPASHHGGRRGVCPRSPRARVPAAYWRCGAAQRYGHRRAPGRGVPESTTASSVSTASNSTSATASTKSTSVWNPWLTGAGRSTSDPSNWDCSTPAEPSRYATADFSAYSCELTAIAGAFTAVQSARKCNPCRRSVPLPMKALAPPRHAFFSALSTKDGACTPPTKDALRERFGSLPCRRQSNSRGPTHALASQRNFTPRASLRP